ncbi:MAG TPA: Phenylacetic acid catabolic protein [Chloroflexota bacterium]|nr:Phenylacetic acid catabolic protein [Chloroflexota bacterium]
MTATVVVESPEQIPDERYRALIKQLIESQGYRELMAAHLFGAALQYVPTLALKQMIVHHIEEELEHFARTVELYRELGCGDLEPVVQQRLAQQPVPFATSWDELAMVQFLWDRAGEFHLREYQHCSYRPYARIIQRILEEEEGHEGFGEQVVRELCRDPAYRPRAQELFNKWLRYGLLSFGRPGTPGNAYAVQMGIKTRDSGAVMQAYLDDIKPVMVACGLRFPPREQLGVELPPDIDLSLPVAAPA